MLPQVGLSDRIGDIGMFLMPTAELALSLHALHVYEKSLELPTYLLVAQQAHSHVTHLLHLRSGGWGQHLKVSFNENSIGDRSHPR